MSRLPLSLIDFCTIYDDESAGESMQRSVELAQRAEELGYSRIWYAEHHNMPTIASSSPAVLISHIGARTQKIRLGAGGVMLPNHSPYVIAEQFGTLGELYPDRIDLGLGRAPGTDQNTLGRALRRDPRAAENFPNDVVELHGYFRGRPTVPGVTAVPGVGAKMPLYILGSSMFGATLAAKLGLPYSFASHFAPQHLVQATTYYKENFEPSEVLDQPYVIAAVNVTVAPTRAEAEEQTVGVHRARVKRMMGRRGRVLNDEQLDQVVDSYQGQQIIDMLRFTGIGTGDEVVEYLEEFAELAKADELMISLQGRTNDEAMQSMEILADAWELSPETVVGAPGNF
ncbi:LLM class flavin-dependent oxidoreductase [Corynebacterium cystitidis]|uniref:LLM class flavin-dependent oxidoreductase n=1 Tax=Corynebacterium cystitidis TaxID=35757 RepID=UPI00211EC156|nr:LLM class flavin-dependent oxidoreductase [Corynebacterium cystitidis]